MFCAYNGLQGGGPGVPARRLQEPGCEVSGSIGVETRSEGRGWFESLWKEKSWDFCLSPGAFEQVSCVTEKRLLPGDASESRNLN